MKKLGVEITTVVAMFYLGFAVWYYLFLNLIAPLFLWALWIAHVNPFYFYDYLYMHVRLYQMIALPLILPKTFSPLMWAVIGVLLLRTGKAITHRFN